MISRRSVDQHRKVEQRCLRSCRQHVIGAHGAMADPMIAGWCGQSGRSPRVDIIEYRWVTRLSLGNRIAWTGSPVRRRLVWRPLSGKMPEINPAVDDRDSDITTIKPLRR